MFGLTRAKRTGAAALATAAAAATALLGAPTAVAAPEPIVGGTTTTTTAYPFMMQITDASQNQFCGGTLVSATVVLTAAHCMTDSQGRINATPGQRQVLLGRHDLYATGGEKLDVAEIVVDPGYDPTTKQHDLAVLHLTRASRQTPAPMLNPSTATARGTLLTVMGWGQIAEGDDAASSSKLLAADIPLWSDSECTSVYGAKYVASVMLCAGYQQGGVDSCQGDSGGPIMVAVNGQWNLIGVVSFGYGCARQGIPGIYAWINGTGMRSFIDAQIARPAATQTTTQPAAQTAAQPPRPAATTTPAPATQSSAPAPAATPDPAGPAIGTLSVRGRRVSVQVSTDATLSVQLRRGGRRVGGRFEVRASDGLNRFSLRTSRRLRRGRYTLEVAATDWYGHRSATRTASFRVR
jgi:secreted trypsin-like serine protease